MYYVTCYMASHLTCGAFNPLHLVPSPHRSLLPVHPSFWLLSLTARIVPMLQRWRLHCECIALITMLHLGPRKHSPSRLGLAGVQEPHFLVLSRHLPCGLPWRVYQFSCQDILSLIIGASYQYSLLAFLHPTAICFLLTLSASYTQSSWSRFVLLSTETNPELP